MRELKNHTKVNIRQTTPILASKIPPEIIKLRARAIRICATHRHGFFEWDSCPMCFRQKNLRVYVKEEVHVRDRRFGTQSLPIEIVIE